LLLVSGSQACLPIDIATQLNVEPKQFRIVDTALWIFYRIYFLYLLPYTLSPSLMYMPRCHGQVEEIYIDYHQEKGKYNHRDQGMKSRLGIPITHHCNSVTGVKREAEK
jgi:hypothetical protein